MTTTTRRISNKLILLYYVVLSTSLYHRSFAFSTSFTSSATAGQVSPFSHWRRCQYHYHRRSMIPQKRSLSSLSLQETSRPTRFLWSSTQLQAMPSPLDIMDNLSTGTAVDLPFDIDVNVNIDAVQVPFVINGIDEVISELILLSKMTISEITSQPEVMAALTAYGHYLSFMIITACIAVEKVTIKPNMTDDEENRLVTANSWLGLAGVMLVLSGYYRTVFYEKGWDFYSNVPTFWVKMFLVSILGAMSFFPTTKIIQRAIAKRNGTLQPMSEKLAKRMTSILNAELLALFTIPATATFMARGEAVATNIPWQVDVAIVTLILFGLGGKYIKEALSFQEENDELMSGINQAAVGEYSAVNEGNTQQMSSESMVQNSRDVMNETPQRNDKRNSPDSDGAKQSSINVRRKSFTVNGGYTESLNQSSSNGSGSEEPQMASDSVMQSSRDFIKEAMQRNGNRGSAGPDEFKPVSRDLFGRSPTTESQDSSISSSEVQMASDSVLQSSRNFIKEAMQRNGNRGSAGPDSFRPVSRGVYGRSPSSFPSDLTKAGNTNFTGNTGNSASSSNGEQLASDIELQKSRAFIDEAMQGKTSTTITNDPIAIREKMRKGLRS